MGASMAYTGSWNMTGWLTKNIPSIRLHSKTVYLLRVILGELGYGDLINTLKFINEV